MMVKVEYVVELKERMLKDLRMHSKVFGESIILKALGSSYYFRDYTTRDLENGFKTLILEGSLEVKADSIVPKLVKFGLTDDVYSCYEDEAEDEDKLQARYINIEQFILCELIYGTSFNRNYKPKPTDLLKWSGFNLVDFMFVLDSLENRDFIKVTKKNKIKLSDSFKFYIERFNEVETELYDEMVGLENFLSNIRGQVNELNLAADLEDPDYDFELDYDEELELMGNLDLLDATEENEEEEKTELERYEALEDYIFPEISRNLYWYVKNKRCVK